MSDETRRNWFDSGGNNYAKFRPTYPEALAEYLSGFCENKSVAVDVGCGNGQLTSLLANHFDRVIGVDPSADQLANAIVKPGIDYLQAPAELLPIPDASADLITAAQAAHWFNLPIFYDEVRRIAKPLAKIALVSYGNPVIGRDQAQEVFAEFNFTTMATYWPPERHLVDDGYRTIEFPFSELHVTPMSLAKELNLEQMLGYVSTWSAVRVAREKNRTDLLDTFAEALRRAWGSITDTHLVTWPINIRIGVVDK